MAKGKRPIFVREAAGVKDSEDRVASVKEFDEETGDTAGAGTDGESGCREAMVRTLSSSTAGRTDG